jgi:D-3-phosphoglycerate dehydrogenase / 2-oxoglutarate reductase
MKKIKILCMINTELCPHALEPLTKVAQVEHLPIDRKTLLKKIGEYDAYYGHTDILIDREIIDKAKRLKVIAAPSTGTDHIDVTLLKERGIKLLALTHEYNLLDTFTATAECSWALLLACIRKLPAASVSVEEGCWAREKYTGRQLAGKTLGVLGVGRLGKMIVEYGKAFRMHVLGCDLKDFSIPGVERVDFDTLLRESDIISIHIHLDDESRGLISSKAFEKMKNGVVITNTSRGGVIDEQAFLKALKSKKVAAAGLDVIDGEWLEDITEHPLVKYAQKHNNLVITPHIGGAAVESIAGARIYLAQKLADYIQQNL